MTFDDRDEAIIANNIFRELCMRPEGWYDITTLSEETKAYTNRIDVAYLAEDILIEMRYIERDLHTNNVRYSINYGKGFTKD